MTLLERYLKGGTEKVYIDVYSLGQGAFKPDCLSQIDLRLTETFKKASNYQFVSKIKYDWESPLVPPAPKHCYLCRGKTR